MTIRLFSSLLKLTKNYHLWLIALMFAIGVILHYPQQLLSIDSTSLLSFLGLTRHAAERVFLLLPITYAAFFLGVRVGLFSLIIALTIMLPRDLIISQYPQDSILETTIIIIIGGLINIFLYIRRRDITNLKKVENKLQLAYTEIEQIFKTSSVGIRVIDTEFNILQCNKSFAHLSKMPLKQILGNKCYKVLSHGLCHTDRCLLRRILNGEEYVEGEFKKETPDGSHFYAVCTATPYRQPDGKTIGIIESTNDITQLKRAEEGLRYYLQEITKAQEEERKRISRELHDSTAQNLVALLRQLENYLNERDELQAKDSEPLWSFYQQIKDISQELRRFSRDLRPPMLDELGLLPSLEWLIEGFKTDYNLELEMEIAGTQRKLPRESELLLFRIIQEVIRNVVKHAQASKAGVKIEFHKDKTTITISDDGIGFKVPDNLKNLAKKGKLGLSGIEERVRLLNGKLSIESELGIGTKIFIEIPHE